jgi:nucleoside-diphosphate-sugar epimerase
MNIVILGCGEVGGRAGALLVALGHQVLGVRRRPLAHGRDAFTVVSGDASDPTLYIAVASAMPRVDAVVLCANPGLRRGRDNGLDAAATLVHGAFPDCRLIYTGSTAVYADAQSGSADEGAAVAADDAAVAGLLRIERAVAQHASALVLRATALVGPTRLHALDRLREAARLGQACVVRGDLERPFSYLHEQDLAEVCAEAAVGVLGTGVLNAASPHRLTVGDYYRTLAARAGIPCTLHGDGTPAPRRWIDAGRLHALLPGRRWRTVDEG